jgi:hypothetical protein
MVYLEERTLYPERSFLTGLPPLVNGSGNGKSFRPTQ